jgi:hypothetical protein
MKLQPPRFGLRTLLGLVAACAFGSFLARVIWKSGPVTSTFLQPPPLLAAGHLGEAVVLFDSKTMKQWKIDGPATVSGGNLELGGVQPSAAYFESQFGMDFEVSFDFFQEGPGPAGIRIKTILLDSNKSYDVKTDLHRSNFVYKRWHHCDVAANYDSGHFTAEMDVDPIGDGYGGSSQGSTVFPTRGCRCLFGFETGANSKLYLRNIVLKSKASLLEIESAPAQAN